MGGCCAAVPQESKKKALEKANAPVIKDKDQITFEKSDFIGLNTMSFKECYSLGRLLG